MPAPLLPRSVVTTHYPKHCPAPIDAHIPNANESPASSTVQNFPSTSKKGAALRLVSTKDLAREDWLQVRRQGIGSSDAATAVGLNPYQSPLELWMHKTGKAELLPAMDPNDESSPMYWGTLLEPIVAAHYTKRTGRKVRRINAVLQHADHAWMLANIDREVVGCKDVQILECKTAGLHGAKLWRDGVPEYVQLQVMHQLAVTGYQAADVAVLICGQDLQIHRIERNDIMMAQLIALEQQFWEYVQSDVQPMADASQSAQLALRCLYPQDSGETLDLSEEPDSAQAFLQLLQLRDRLTQMQTQEALLKHQIQQRIGQATYALFNNGSVSFKRSKDSTSLDSSLLQAEHPELAQRYLTTKPGTRRFLVHSQH